MKQFNKKFSVILLSVCLLSTQSALAARFGKSRSMGMQRSVPTRSANTNSYHQNQNMQQNRAPQQQVNQPRQGVGMGGVVAGAAAGAVGGYMLGKAMNSNEKSNASQATTNQTAASGNENNTAPTPSKQFQWGIIAILALLLAIGLVIFRRKGAPQTSQGNMNNNYNNNGNTNNTQFSIPSIRRDNNSNQINPNSAPKQDETTSTCAKTADGTETQYFLRQAKGMFLHIQSMNTPDNVSEIAKYLTPDLYQELKSSVNENDYVADFSDLNCQLLDSTTEKGDYIASVKFSGKVSEAPNQAPIDFNEIWHFVKPTNLDGAKWVVAGIQQVN